MKPEEIDSSADLRKALFPKSIQEATATSIYLEQYKLYVQLVDKVSDRRQSTNSFFLSINTGLCALLGYLFKEGNADLRPLLWVIPLPGILLCYFWARLVRSYRYLNAAKFSVVEMMEEHLPVAPFRGEWVSLQKGPARYKPLTTFEVWIPRSFLIMYVAMLIFLGPWHRLFG